MKRRALFAALAALPFMPRAAPEREMLTFELDASALRADLQAALQDLVAGTRPPVGAVSIVSGPEWFLPELPEMSAWEAMCAPVSGDSDPASPSRASDSRALQRSSPPIPAAASGPRWSWSRR